MSASAVMFILTIPESPHSIRSPARRRVRGEPRACLLWRLSAPIILKFRGVMSGAYPATELQDRGAGIQGKTGPLVYSVRLEPPDPEDA